MVQSPWRIDRFEDARKQVVWIPMQVVWESFGGIHDEDRGTYGTDATNRETYTVLPESVKVGSGFKDDRFNVKFKTGTMITDALKQAHHDFGRNLPVGKTVSSSEDLQAVLGEQVRMAESQGEDLLASSRERSGTGWWDWSPWLVSAGSLTALIAVCLRTYRANHK